MKSILTLAILIAGSALAKDTGLYAPAPPANSAFVRVLNSPTAILGTATITSQARAASPYVIIPQGDFTVKIGSVSTKVNVAAGKFYTVVPMAGKLALLTDQTVNNKAKALLTIYNLTKIASVDLKTADGKTAVVSGVKIGKSGSRAVNGITVDLAAFSGSKSLGTLKGVRLERGNAYALVLTDTGLTLTTSTTQTK